MKSIVFLISFLPIIITIILLLYLIRNKMLVNMTSILIVVMIIIGIIFVMFIKWKLNNVEVDLSELISQSVIIILLLSVLIILPNIPLIQENRLSFSNALISIKKLNFATKLILIHVFSLNFISFFASIVLFLKI